MINKNLDLNESIKNLDLNEIVKNLDLNEIIKNLDSNGSFDIALESRFKWEHEI